MQTVSVTGDQYAARLKDEIISLAREKIPHFGTLLEDGVAYYVASFVTTVLRTAFGDMPLYGVTLFST